MKLKEIVSNIEKEKISANILHKLPNWFGIPESTQEYIAESKKMPFFAAYEDKNEVGFLAIKTNNRYTAEIYVMGVLDEYHRQGIGKNLVKCCYDWCQNNGYEYLQVKTLDESNPDIHYAGTRKFYESMGFRPLECFPTLWDESNPCLIMIMSIKLWAAYNTI